MRCEICIIFLIFCSVVDAAPLGLMQNKSTSRQGSVPGGNVPCRKWGKDEVAKWAKESGIGKFGPVQILLALSKVFCRSKSKNCFSLARPQHASAHRDPYNVMLKRSHFMVRICKLLTLLPKVNSYPTNMQILYR